MNIHTLQTKAAEFGISVESAIKMRIRYLLGLIDRWADYIDEKTNDMPESTSVDALNEIIRLRNFEQSLKQGRNTKSSITDEMIESARNYPIENIIEFRNGKALAWCHADKNPSLTWYKAKNRATCFPCGKSFSALDVLMDRDGKSFINAVRELC